MGLDIGDAVAEAGNDRGSIGFVVDAAAHEIDGHVDRLHDDALARSECVIERSQRGEFKKALGSRERSEEHTSELQSLMRISYAVFCLKKKKQIIRISEQEHIQTTTTSKRQIDERIER